jgi:dethiobiotin synthetase
MKKACGLFVSGTDTGVGKTMIAAAIVRSALRRGLRVAVLKPVETGCAQTADGLMPADGMFLRSVAGLSLPIEQIVPLRYATPVSPLVASRREGLVPDSAAIHAAYRQLAESYDFVVVEGAGGLMVPITHEYFMIDLVRDLGLPLVLVAGTRLGTINHTLLSIRLAAAAGVEVAGVVLNQVAAPVNDVAEQTNPEVLRELLSVPVVGPFPYLAEKTIAGIDAALEQVDPGVLML